MTERADISVDWGIFSRTSPRIIEVALPSVALTVQDLVDTLRSNTLAAGEADDSLDNMDDDRILDSSGKEDLGGGTLVGITAALQNARIRFEARAGPDVVRCVISGGNLVTFLSDEGSHTGADSATVYIDSAGGFQSFGLEAGMDVENVTDGSKTTVTTVDSETQIACPALTGGTDNTFQAGDVIKVSGFVNPIATAAFTTIVIQGSSSATISETGVSGLTAAESAALTSAEAKSKEIWQDRGLEVGNKVTITPSKRKTEDLAIDLDLSGDGVSQTVIDRQ